MIRAFNERSFYRLTWKRFRVLGCLDGLAPLVYLYFCDRAGRQLGAASWETYAKDCCPGLTVASLRQITLDLIARGELLTKKQSAGVWNILPSCSAMLGAKADGNFLRLTTSLRHWLGLQLLGKNKLVRGRLLHVLLHSMMLFDDIAQRGHGKSWAALATHAADNNLITPEQYRWCAMKLHKQGCLTIQRTKGGRHVLTPNLPKTPATVMSKKRAAKIAERNEVLEHNEFVSELIHT